MSEMNFFTYKGYPLIRNKDTIYYGNMTDDYVVMIQVMEKKKVGELEIASRLKVYQVSTDESKNPVEAICKTSEKNGLYDALDIAHIWLKRANAS